MRRGKIINITLSEGRGFIIDENDEEIPFCLKMLDNRLGIADEVLFEIVKTNYGLTAMNIKALVA
ncbi:cold-shock protein [Pedobacter frigidisoli]|uniref:Cold-shock protein n=1 Tax=Pedobacter frigidisoli TaxID=2530455 RepID=A0A4R0NYS1_9SPHI|nr:cold-shock protein [Pedobacter frigidisoli]TCD07589.1 cold-shock protein [Pedobacter frigidisoli]